MLCKSILLVEDDLPIREAVDRILKDEGYDVVAVSNGKEALRVIRKLPAPTLVLLDMMMPLMNGWEFTEAWREEILKENCCIVVISALDARRALNPGGAPVPAQAYIRKPIELSTLLETVELYCGLPGPAQAAAQENVAEPASAAAS
jgi:CheY-like chemotaxis protein